MDLKLNVDRFFSGFKMDLKWIVKQIKNRFQSGFKLDF